MHSVQECSKLLAVRLLAFLSYLNLECASWPGQGAGCPLSWLGSITSSDKHPPPATVVANPHVASVLLSRSSLILRFPLLVLDQCECCWKNTAHRYYVYGLLRIETFSPLILPWLLRNSGCAVHWIVWYDGFVLSLTPAISSLPYLNFFSINSECIRARIRVIRGEY